MLNGIISALHKRILVIWFTVLIVLAMLPNSFIRETPLQFSITILLFVGYIFLFWIPKQNWKPYWIEFSAILIGVASLLKGIVVGGEAYGLLIPLAVFIGFNIGGKRSVLYATFFGVCTTLLLVIDQNLDLVFISPFVLTYIGCYVGSRGYRLQSEAYEANQRHFAELQKAHAELQEAHQQLQDAAIDTMQVAVLEERTRIARDIHDALGHSLTSLIVQLHALKYMLQDGPPHAQEAVQNMLGVAKQSLEEIRSSVHTLASDGKWLGLMPLRALVSQVEKHTGLKLEITSDDLDMLLTQEFTITLYRILQEAITNTLRHSNATRMTVTVEERNGSIHLTIQDNGSITRQTQVKPGFGLTGIRDRIESLHGTLTYFIRETNGFQLNVTIPIKKQENHTMGKERDKDAQHKNYT